MPSGAVNVPAYDEGMQCTWLSNCSQLVLPLQITTSRGRAYLQGQELGPNLRRANGVMLAASAAAAQAAEGWCHSFDLSRPRQAAEAAPGLVSPGW